MNNDITYGWIINLGIGGLILSHDGVEIPFSCDSPNHTQYLSVFTSFYDGTVTSVNILALNVQLSTPKTREEFLFMLELFNVKINQGRRSAIWS